MFRPTASRLRLGAQVTDRVKALIGRVSKELRLTGVVQGAEEVTKFFQKLDVVQLVHEVYR